ncbi:MAG TPA: hypothetical protein VNQ76_17595 [Planctomicrobium sp.]|nr:hypothetical protein [Planctomicrobium sp.]
MNEIVGQYTQRFNLVLTRLDRRLREFLDSTFESLDCVCKLSTRPKRIDSFVKKSEAINEDGNFKYTDPLSEIQDQLGALIVTRFLSDLSVVEKVVTNTFRGIEQQRKEPESEYEFGYFGRHFVLFLPSDITSEFEEDDIPQFFELQIKTLFQYAWSETNHAIGYKRRNELTFEQRRLTAYVAAQAWGADQAVDDLRRAVETTT